jgi:septal ring factor EnvC (AmiA/AmiB activator)
MEAAVVALFTALPGLIAGPASAVVICLLAMYGAGYVLVKFILPEQREALNKVLADSAENRAVFKQAVEIIDERFRSIEKNVSAVKKDVNRIEQDISEIKMKI